MSIYILDTETTDKKDGEVIELAAMKVTFNQNTYSFRDAKNYFHQYYKPEGNISYGAMATHHIIPEDLEDMPVFAYTDDILPDLAYMIGHNIKFDWEAIGEPSCKLIDTLALARQAWPELDSHTQSALIYYLAEDKGVARDRLKSAHSAIHDIGFCFIILNAAIAELREKGISFTDIRDIYLFSEEARIPVLMPVGKHKDTPIAELPIDYVEWFLRQPDVEESLKLALLDRKYPGTIGRYLEQLAND